MRDEPKMQRPVLVTPPAAALVTAAEAKAQTRISTDAEDTLIDRLIATATARLDGYAGVLGRALITQTWRVSFSRFPARRLRLPLGDLQSVTGVTYRDTDDAEQTLATSVYAAHEDAIGPYITLKDGQSWPATYARDDAVAVTWVAGYGDAASDVPQAIRHAAMMLLGHWYENREASAIGVSVAALPLSVEALVMQYRRGEI